MKKKYVVILIVILAACSSLEDSGIKQNEILWDNYGVPHIYASSDSSLYYMAGWAQMKNHGDLILKLYGEARGTSAELWGEGFEVNKHMHQLGIIDQLETSYNNLKPRYQTMLTSFANGVNTYAATNRSSLNEDYLKILPVKETDLIAHYFRVVNYEFLIKQQLKATERSHAGSNAWAVSGKKTSTGKAMLVANPHLPWSDLFLWHEQQFVTDKQNIYGASLIGSPSIIIGFNNHISWTHTVNPMDNTDFFEIKKKGNTYYLDGEYLPFQEFTYSIKEKKEDGTIETYDLVRKTTKHGVVIKETEDKVIAMRFAQMENYMPYLEQYDLMGRALNLEDFKQALSLRQMPFLNTLYADNEDNIMHHFGGLIPKKNGDWNKWQQIVSGDASEDIWTEYYESTELPTVVNPSGGWLQNANEPPFINTLPVVLNPEDFASHITPDINTLSFRAQHSAKLLHEEENISFNRLAELKHDNKSEFALRIQDDLLELRDMTTDSLTLAAIETLTAWDGSFNSNSLGTILFVEFINTIRREKQLGSYQLYNIFSESWNIDNPIETPDTFKSPSEMLALLKVSAKKHLSKYPTLELPYGDYYKLKVGKNEFPGTGGPQYLGVFRIMMTISPTGEGITYADFGDTFVLVVEMGEKVKAKGLLTYGNSSNPNSPHYGDQLELFSKNELREILFTRKAQELNLEEKQSLHDLR